MKKLPKNFGKLKTGELRGMCLCGKELPPPTKEEIEKLAKWILETYGKTFKSLADQ